MNYSKHRSRLFIVATVLIFSGLFMITSCTEDTPAEQAIVHLNKNASIDVTMSTTHLNSFDVLNIEKTLYNEQGRVVSTSVMHDTLPQLSLTKDTLNTGRIYEDENGDNQEIDTAITHPKNYEIYITVK